MGRWLCWKCACCRFENLGSNPQNPCKKPDVVANTCDPGNGEEGRGDEEIALCLLPKLLWSTWWGSRPVSNTVANRRCKVPEECNLRLFSNLHMYTQAHLCTDTHTQNMHIHMHANAQTHQFQNEIWVKIVKKKKKSNTLKSQVLLSENYSIRSHKEETWQRTAYPSQCWANLPCHVQRHCSQL